MSERRYPGKRKGAMYDPESDKPFNLSRSRIDLFKQCMRCFYIDRRLGVDRPPTFPFKLNNAVDNLLKNEFDAYRVNGWQHPLLEEKGIDARPAQHDNLSVWRENFKGIRHLHEPTNFTVFGAIDDLWVNSNGEHIVVDYKATANSTPITEISQTSHREGYERQLEVYQWLLRRNGLEVSDTAYWLYCTGQPDNGRFRGQLDFDMHLIAHDGDDSWVEPTLHDIKRTLDGSEIPEASPDCDHCRYVEARRAAEAPEQTRARRFGQLLSWVEL